MTNRRMHHKHLPKELRPLFMDKVQKSCGVCPECESDWNWLGNNKTAMHQAVIEIAAVRYPVKKQVYQIASGKIVPDDYCVISTCQNQSCLNPKMLMCLSKTKMLERMRAISRLHDAKHKAALQVARRKRGDLKLSMEKADEIRNSSETATELAKRYGVSREAVCMVRRGETWRGAVGNMFSGLMR